MANLLYFSFSDQDKSSEICRKKRPKVFRPKFDVRKKNVPKCIKFEVCARFPVRILISEYAEYVPIKRTVVTLNPKEYQTKQDVLPHNRLHIR